VLYTFTTNLHMLTRVFAKYKTYTIIAKHTQHSAKTLKYVLKTIINGFAVGALLADAFDRRKQTAFIHIRLFAIA
jgi:hypothetical protein